MGEPFAGQIVNSILADTDRINWLSTVDRVSNVAYRMVAEGVDVRMAIDWLMGQPAEDE